MYEGVYTAIVTPFDEAGKIDEKALRRFVDFQIEGGVDGIVTSGTTGESPTLSSEEVEFVLTVALEQAKGRIKVIAGTGSNNTEKTIHMTKMAKDRGACASLQVCPYYNKPTQEGLYRHFIAIAEAVDLPQVVYNVQSRTARNIDNSTMLKMAAHKNITTVKEASADIGQMMDLIAKKPDSLTILSGDDNITFPLMALGGRGVISVASNVVPDKVCAMVRAALNKNWEEARRRHYELLPLFEAMFYETNPIPVKAALAMKGLIKETYRLPMCEMNKEKREKLKSVMDRMGII